MKYRKFLLIVLILGITLAACGKSNDMGGEDRIPEDKMVNKGGKDKEETNKDEILEDGGHIIEGEEGLIYLSIKDGEAFLYLNLDEWVKAYDFYGFEEIYPGPYSIGLSSGRVKDASIGIVDNIDFRYVGFPTIFILTDEGRVEWLNFIPEDLEEGSKKVDTMGILEGLPHFSSLTDDEGVDFHRLALSLKYSSLTKGVWTWGGPGSWLWEGAKDIEVDHLEDYYGSLTFNEDKSLIFEKGYYGEEPRTYKGVYDLWFPEDVKPGTGVLTISLDGDGETSQGDKIEGTFSTETLYLYELMLYQTRGDLLFGGLIDFPGPYVFLHGD